MNDNALHNILVPLVQSQRLAPPIKTIRTRYLLKKWGLDSVICDRESSAWHPPSGDVHPAEHRLCKHSAAQRQPRIYARRFCLALRVQQRLLIARWQMRRFRGQKFLPAASQATCVMCCNCDVLRREAVLMREIMNETCFMDTYTSQAVVERAYLKKKKKQRQRSNMLNAGFFCFVFLISLAYEKLT